MESEFIFEGKKYISASRASKLSGYTADYIGQLCRKNCLECRRVGRVWFVNEESLKNHKVAASSTPRGRIPIYQKLEAEGARQVPIAKRPIVNHANSAGQYAFRSFEHTDLFLDSAELLYEKRLKRAFARQLAGGLLALFLFIVAVPAFVFSGNFDVGSFVSPGNQKISAVQEKLALALASVQKYPVEVKGSLAYSAAVFESVGETLGRELDDFIFSPRGYVASLTNFFKAASQEFRVAFLGESDVDRVRQSSISQRDGVVVVPSANDDETNAAVEEYVTNSFSDEAEIVPHEDGNSGLIKPVFKERDDQEYLYVIVPVKEGGD